MLNRNVDAEQLAFLLASMKFTIDALNRKIITPNFACKRLSFDIETAQGLVGSEMVSQSGALEITSHRTEADDLREKLNGSDTPNNPEG